MSGSYAPSHRLSWLDIFFHCASLHPIHSFTPSLWSLIQMYPISFHMQTKPPCSHPAFLHLRFCSAKQEQKRRCIVHCDETCGPVPRFAISSLHPLPTLKCTLCFWTDEMYNPGCKEGIANRFTFFFFILSLNEQVQVNEKQYAKVVHRLPSNLRLVKRWGGNLWGVE